MERTSAFPRRAVVSAAGCVCLVYVVLFWRLGFPTFWDPDEAHYAQTTREMLASGDWLVPVYNGTPFFDKPIFFHWLQGASMHIGGHSETAARMAPACAALLLILITGWLGLQLSGPAAGLLAALLLASNPGLFGLARYAIIDAPFSACLFGGVSLLVVSALKNRPRLQYGGFVLIALATCLKGPIAPLLCGLAFTIAVSLSPEARRRLTGLHLVRGLVLILVLATPWFVYMFNRFGQSFVEGYFLNENLRLFAKPMYANQPGWWFYPMILAAGFLPWTGLFIGRVYDQLRALGGRRAPDVVDVLLWSWVVAIVAFFSLSSFKLDHYVFPAVPALCLIAARAWMDLCAGWQAERNRGSRIGVRFIGPTLGVVGVVVGTAAIRQLSLPASFLVVPVTLAVLASAVTVRYARRDPQLPRVPVLVLLSLGLLYGGALVWVIPKIEQGKVVPDLAHWVAEHAGRDDRVATFRLNRWNPSYRFYVNRPVTMLESDEDARRFFSDPAGYYCVMTADLYEALHAAGVPLKVVHSRDGIWATSGKALWRAPIELTRFVVTTDAGRVDAR